MAAVVAKSFLSDADGFERALAAARSAVGRPAGALVFVSGALGLSAPRVADAARRVLRGAPFCVVPAGGVLTERGEVEAAAAASGLVWSEGATRAIGVGEGEDLGEGVARSFGKSGGAAILFASRPPTPTELAGTGARAPRVAVFGAGTIGAPALAYDERGEPVPGATVGLGIQRLSPLVRSSPACRLLSTLETIEEADAGLVLRTGGTAALDRLSACATATTMKPGVEAPHPVVFAALADADTHAEEPAPFVVRPLRGIDPTRRGLLVGPEAAVGTRLGFAVRDAATARAGVEAMARAIAQDATGSAPRFALLITCAGRGQGLYGTRDVESRILRQRFGDLPVVGMHGAFELVPWSSGDPRLALYTALVALFRSPS